MKKLFTLLVFTTIALSLYLTILSSNSIYAKSILEANVEALLSTESPEEYCKGRGGIWNALLQHHYSYPFTQTCIVGGQLEIGLESGPYYNNALIPGVTYTGEVEVFHCISYPGDCCINTGPNVTIEGQSKKNGK